MQLVYLGHFGFWSVFITVLGELVLTLYLTGLKLHLDGISCSRGSPSPPAAENARTPLEGGGGDGDIYINDLPDERGDENVFVFRGSSAQAFAPE